LIALDTNILLRHLAEPDSKQGKLATTTLEETLTRNELGFLSVITIVELIWVMRRHYGVLPEEMRSIIAEVASLPQLVLEHDHAIRRALQSNHADLADVILHEIGREADCQRMLTFDRKFAQLEGVELLN
jgi:predicted nucleic-acid-binding protein